jgi:hypothetical protein
MCGMAGFVEGEGGHRPAEERAALIGRIGRTSAV